ILADTAEGDLQPPAWSSDLFTQGYAMPFKLLGVYVVLAIIQYQLSALLGLWSVGVVSLLINLLLPAMIMTLAVSGSLITALTPTTVIGLIWRIGWPYLVLYVFVNLLYSIVGGIFMLLHETLPQPLLMIVVVFATMYVSIIAHNVMGYAMYQYADVLGLGIPPPIEYGVNAMLSVYHRFL